MGTKIKICGLKRVEDARIVNKFLPDYVGFILAPSKRHIQFEEAKILRQKLDPSIRVVGVFVNESIEKIRQYEAERVIDVIQLHGDEDTVYLKLLRNASHLPIIKAFRIRDLESLNQQKSLMEDPLLDGILLDAYSKQGYGGVGKSFDWKLLDQVKRPYFLAGGIGIDNVKEALKHHPYAIDVSSKVETEGFKDAKKIEELIKAVREME